MSQFIGIIILLAGLINGSLAQPEPAPSVTSDVSSGQAKPWDVEKEIEQTVKEFEEYCNIAKPDVNNPGLLTKDKTTRAKYGYILELAQADCRFRLEIIKETIEKAKTRPTAEEFYTILQRVVIEDLDPVWIRVHRVMSKISETVEDEQVRSAINAFIEELREKVGHHSVKSVLHQSTPSEINLIADH